MLNLVPPRALGQRGVDAVCVTHLHGDHVYGLPGLLSSMTLGGRTRILHLLGPPSLRDFIEATLTITSARSSFELRYVVLPEGPSINPVLSLRDLNIYSLPLRHRIEAYGFCVSSPPQLRRLRPGVVDQYKIPYSSIEGIKRGADLTVGPLTVTNLELTCDPHPRQTFAYLTDTAPLDAWPASWPTPDVLLHDATFSPADASLAAASGHSTTAQAAAFAKTSGAATLLLSHASVRYGREQCELLAGEADAIMASGEPGNHAQARWAVQGEQFDI